MLSVQLHLVWLFILYLFFSCCCTINVNASELNCKATSCPNSVCSDSLVDPTGYTCACPSNFVPVNTSTEEYRSGTQPCRASCALSNCGVICPAGWLCSSSSATQTEPVYAQLCPAGSVCPGLTAGQALPCVNPQAANISVYCPVGSIKTTLCPASFYCPSFNTSAPIPCPPGSSCVSGSFRPTICKPGTVCPSTSLPPVTCGRGRFCPFANMTSSLPCPLGNICPTPGTTTATPCSVGTFCPPGSQQANNCTAGRYCSNPSSSLPCPAGFYCPPGSTMPQPCQTPGTSCPSFSSQPVPCQAGYSCPTTASSGVPCPATTYCPAGSATALPCPEGHSCLAKSVEPLSCPVGTLCPEKSSTPTPCPQGEWCTWLISSPCSDGYDCRDGIMLSCALGYSCKNGLATPCPSGTRCPHTGMAEPLPCEAGTYDDREKLTEESCQGKCSFWFSNSAGSTSCTNMSPAGLAIVILLPLGALVALLYAIWSFRQFSVKAALQREVQAEKERARLLLLAKEQLLGGRAEGGATGKGVAGAKRTGEAAALTEEGAASAAYHAGAVGGGSDRGVDTRRTVADTQQAGGVGGQQMADSPVDERHRRVRDADGGAGEGENEDDSSQVDSLHHAIPRTPMLPQLTAPPARMISHHPSSRLPLAVALESPNQARARQREERLAREVAQARYEEDRRYALHSLVLRLVIDLGSSIELPKELVQGDSMLLASFQHALRTLLLSILSSQELTHHLDLLTRAPVSGVDAVPSLHASLFPDLVKLGSTCLKLFAQEYCFRDDSLIGSVSRGSSKTRGTAATTSSSSSVGGSRTTSKVSSSSYALEIDSTDATMDASPPSLTPVVQDGMSTALSSMHSLLYGALIPSAESWYSLWCPAELVDEHVRQSLRLRMEFCNFTSSPVTRYMIGHGSSMSFSLSESASIPPVHAPRSPVSPRATNAIEILPASPRALSTVEPVAVTPATPSGRPRVIIHAHRGSATQFGKQPSIRRPSMAAIATPSQAIALHDAQPPPTESHEIILRIE